MTRLFVFAIVTLLAACGAPAVPPADGGVPLGDAALSDATVNIDVLELVDAPGSDAPGTPLDAPGADATDLYTREGFARAHAERQCAAWAACSACTDPTPTCVETLMARYLEHPPENFHPEMVDAYLARLDEAYGACERLSTREYTTYYPHRGTGQPGVGVPTFVPETYGDPCVSHEDCETLHCQPAIWPDGGTRGMCFPLPDAGPRQALCL